MEEENNSYENDMGDYMSEEESSSGSYDSQEDYEDIYGDVEETMSNNNKSFNNLDSHPKQMEEAQSKVNSILQPVSSNTRNQILNSRKYITKLLDQRQLKDLLIEKIIEIRNKFSFANLEDGILLDYLRSSKFQVGQASNKLEQNIFSFLENRAIKPRDSLTSSQDEMICLIDGMELEEHEAHHLGCGHTFCEDCLQEYIFQKVKDGPAAIFAECPEDGCGFRITMNIVSIICEKNISDM